jgi:hypothetical protein
MCSSTNCWWRLKSCVDTYALLEGVVKPPISQNLVKSGFLPEADVSPMPKPSVKRPVRQVDTSGQRELFPRVPGASASVSRPATKQPHFEYPDARAIQIGSLGLEEHLKQSGIRDVFVIRPFLDAQDWSAFEAAYSCIGRLAYAPPAMLGLILYGIMQGQSSLRELEHLARINLGCWWLTGGIMPDRFGDRAFYRAAW